MMPGDEKGLAYSLENIQIFVSMKEETNMSDLRYPNEGRKYRDARESLLKDEQALLDKVRSVAQRRRNLPPAGN
jgi:predicted dithiol-disulfide oxidoreductase (DUF899 family)